MDLITLFIAMERRSDLRLRRMIADEIEVISFRKELYDLTEPEHVKDVSQEEFHYLAQKRVLDRLASPGPLAEYTL